ncbi:retrograde protein of 51 kDa-like isoform X2 [Babylonia areolata]|uniref:retrograde protein of 51 kDa-like isoform X2 n=1 Tax=Babylonia areolata TaxID=304850 RepID=UPI003FD34BE9
MTSVSRTTTSSRTVTSGGLSHEEELTTYRPKSAIKNVIIQRGSTGGRSRSSMYGSSGFSARTSMPFNAAVYSQMAGSDIAGFRDTREKEKKEMQDCNERLATYIEKVRWLEAKTKQLEAENDALRKRKQEDWRPIKDMFEQELQQAREVIKELSTQKGIGEAKLAGLQDEIESLKDLIGTYESQARDYVKKIDQLNSQIGEYEGELNTLRLRCGSLEDEAAKLRALVNKYKEENARLRADLDAETAAHIEQEVLAQTKTEEVEFLQELLDRVQVSQQEPVTVKGQDMEQFFKGELRQAVQAMQLAYDEKLDQITMECEAKVVSQVNQLKSGNVRESMESEHAKSEVKRLRDQLAEKNAIIARLESALAVAQAERDTMASQLSELQLEFESYKVDSSKKLMEAQMQIEALMQELQNLLDRKMSLELEIACYRKLLEGEENRSGLRQLVEQTIGVKGSGAGQLSDIIGGSSSSSSTSMSIQKSRAGAFGIKEVDASGRFVELELDMNARGNQELRNVKLVKKVNGQEKISVDLASFGEGKLQPGGTIKVWATGARNRAEAANDLISSTFSFGAGAGDFLILDGTREMASCKLRQN